MIETTRFITKAQDNHNLYGGMIYFSDFEGSPYWSNEKRGSYIAARIASDMKFDDDCRRNIEGRTYEKKENK